MNDLDLVRSWDTTAPNDPGRYIIRMNAPDRFELFVLPEGGKKYHDHLSYTQQPLT